MFKLIDTFKKNPTLNNAQKLNRYLVRHSMASCMASNDDNAIIKQAEALSQ